MGCFGGGHVDLAETSVARGHLGRSRVKECCLMHQLSVWNIKTYILPKLKKYNFQRKTLFVENRAPGGYLDRFSNSCVLRWKNRFLQFWENVGFYVTKWFLVHQTTPLDPWLVQVTPRRPCSDIQLLNQRAPPTGSTPQIWRFFETQLQRIFWSGLLGMNCRNMIWAKFRHRSLNFQS